MAVIENNFLHMFVCIVGVVLILIVCVQVINPGIFKSFEGFKSTLSPNANYSSEPGSHEIKGKEKEEIVLSNPGALESGPANFGNSESPSDCYPKDQLTPSELLPKDVNSTWAEQNPMGNGSLKGKNFLSAGALLGVNTVGQSLRNANYQLRSEPPNPQVPVSVFLNSTIEPDVNRRSLEIA